MRTGEGCVWDPDDEIEYLLRPNIPLGPVTFPIAQTHFVRFRQTHFVSDSQTHFVSAGTCTRPA